MAKEDKSQSNTNQALNKSNLLSAINAKGESPLYARLEKAGIIDTFVSRIKRKHASAELNVRNYVFQQCRVIEAVNAHDKIHCGTYFFDSKTGVQVNFESLKVLPCLEVFVQPKCVKIDPTLRTDSDLIVYEQPKSFIPHAMMGRDLHLCAVEASQAWNISVDKLGLVPIKPGEEKQFSFSDLSLYSIDDGQGNWKILQSGYRGFLSAQGYGPGYRDRSPIRIKFNEFTKYINSFEFSLDEEMYYQSLAMKVEESFLINLS